MSNKKKTSHYNTGLPIFIFLALMMPFQTRAHAQKGSAKPDTLKVISLEEVVVTANKFENKILNTGSAIDVTGKKEIQTLPVTTWSATLKYLPGITVSSPDGMGLNPQVSIRGFYGEGESGYITVLIDGVPVNDVENNLVSWNLMPLNGIERIELLRGGSSALYGDAALGGVMNIITDKGEKPFTSITANFGSHFSYGLCINNGGHLGKKGKYEFYVNDDHTDGFRDHSRWNSVSFGGKVKFALGTHSSLTLSTNNQLLNSETPGVLNENKIARDMETSLPYFREDGRDESRYLASALFTTRINRLTDLDITLTYQYKKKNNVRTYTQPTPIIDPFTYQPLGYYDTTLYGDSKRRKIITNQGRMDVRLIHVNKDKSFRIAGGIEVNYNAFDNNIYDLFTGFQYDYQQNYLQVDTLSVSGDGYRINPAVYLTGEFKLLEPLKLIAGLRYDLIADKFNGKLPDTSYSENNNAVSPKIALNLSTGKTERYSGSIFISFSKSFKAPTVDQRTDLKRMNYAIFFPAPPAYQMEIFKANPFANPGLKPQRSTNWELGTYQYYKFTDKLGFEINLVGFQINVKDEIDFDLSAMQYENITSSVHTGMETSIKVLYKNQLSGFFNMNYTETKFSSGALEGNFLKGVPRSSYVLGAAYTPDKGIGGSIIFQGAGSTFLDDENKEKISGYGILSAHIDYKINILTFFVDIENILNKSYSTTGYYMNGTKYLYPAMGVFFRGGFRVNF